MSSEWISPERNLALELVRTTEAAAMAAARWVGHGDKIGADQAAVDAMRSVLDGVQMDGTVVIGEGEKDEAPMLYNGERIGNGQPPHTDIAVDPIDGTTLTATGRAGAIAVIAVAEKGSMYDPGPAVYMEKIAVGPQGAGIVDIRLPIEKNLVALAKARGKNVRDLNVMILDRPRHAEIVSDIRSMGSRITLIQDGDVAGAIATAWPDSGVETRSGRRRLRPATTRKRSSASMISSPPTTASLPPPVSPPGSCSEGFESARPRSPPNRWSCGVAPAPPG